MNKDFQLTQDGLDELKQELEDLTSQRGKLADAIKAAREQGDLTENSEYHDAKDEQGRVESRIAEIEHILTNSTVINNGNKNKVGLGSTVSLKNGDKAVQYTLVSSVEADPRERKVSDESPIGQALYGAKVGDEIAVDLPAGTVNYRIEKIS